MPKGFPTISDLRRTIPKGGLLSPSLRKGFGKLDWEKLKKQVTRR